TGRFTPAARHTFLIGQNIGRTSALPKEGFLRDNDTGVPVPTADLLPPCTGADSHVPYHTLDSERARPGGPASLLWHRLCCSGVRSQGRRRLLLRGRD